ncbi:MAG: hypothetical protein CJBNEKGG_03387 [Prosthecobacter sp.]|nr:hypothetical protein [Prosthecobacter sp.]
MKFFKRLMVATLKGSTTPHLPGVARALGISESDVANLASLQGEEREAGFLSLVEQRHGGPVDWRGTAEDIYDILQPCVTAEERACLPPVESIPALRPAETIQFLDERFASAPRALRSMESLGDFSILLLIPRDRLVEFEKAAGPWLI